MIELRQIQLKYSNRAVLDIPFLLFEEGKRYGVIGENGSGKTTLLRIIAGTLKPTSGVVIKTKCQALGYMPQKPYAFSFSVQKNVEIAFTNEPDLEQIAIKALEAVGIQHLINARGDKISGGEAQRMACARIIAKPRDVILLDEPTSSTDIRGTDHIENTLLRYTQDTGCTMLFATHSPAQVLRLADEVIFLYQGRVVERGSARQVVEDPSDPRTKHFLQHWRI